MLALVLPLLLRPIQLLVRRTLALVLTIALLIDEFVPVHGQMVVHVGRRTARKLVHCLLLGLAARSANKLTGNAISSCCAHSRGDLASAGHLVTRAWADVLEQERGYCIVINESQRALFVAYGVFHALGGRGRSRRAASDGLRLEFRLWRRRH